MSDDGKMLEPERRLTWHNEHTCLTIQGAKRSGKSSTGRALIVSRDLQRRIFFDPKRDFFQYAEQVVTTQNALKRYLEDVESDWPFSVCYVPKDMDRPDALAVVCEEAERLEDTVVIADELHTATKAHEVRKSVVTFVRECGHSNCGFWGLSQQPHDVCLDVRSQLNSDEAFYFRLVEQNDTDIIRSRRGKDLAKIVSRLPKFHGFRLIPDIEEPQFFRVDPRGAGALYGLDGRPLDW